MSIQPHGGELVNRYVSENEIDECKQKVSQLKKWKLSDRELSDLEMIASGALSPLTGFMGLKDFRAVLDSMQLANGVPWTIPILMSISNDFAHSLKLDEEITLLDEIENPIAIMKVSEIYEYNREELVLKIFKTNEKAHPGVDAVSRMYPQLVGGNIQMLKKRPYSDFHSYRLDPNETRELFKQKGWKTIVGFQTRNPIHRAHEYLQKCALEIVDGLLIHPIVGETKKDDISADVRMKCYELLIDNYYPGNRVALVVNPASMRYAGPREAIFHAIIRKNYGCTHFIVGRDHAGVGNYYGTYEAQEIFSQFDHNELGIIPLMFEHAFYCQKCGNMASSKTCPHTKENHIFLSGTKVREMLQKGDMPPSEFTRPEVAEILIQSMK
jgi:sulfate adenylyltransferase